jgi:hypothetical protein
MVKRVVASSTVLANKKQKTFEVSENLEGLAAT